MVMMVFRPTEEERKEEGLNACLALQICHWLWIWACMLFVTNFWEEERWSLDIQLYELDIWSTCTPKIEFWNAYICILEINVFEYKQYTKINVGLLCFIIKFHFSFKN